VPARTDVLVRQLDTVPTATVPSVIPLINMVGYSSFVFTAQEFTSTATVTRNWGLTWWADAAQTIFMSSESIDAFVAGSYLNIRGAVKGPYLEVDASAAATVSAQTMTRTVIGTTLLLPERIETASGGFGGLFNTSGGAAQPNQRMFMINVNPGGGVTLLDYPGTMAGEAVLWSRVSPGGAASTTITLFDQRTNNIWARHVYPASAVEQDQTTPIVLSGSATRIELANTAAGGIILRASIQMTGHA